MNAYTFGLRNIALSRTCTWTIDFRSQSNTTHMAFAMLQLRRLQIGSGDTIRVYNRASQMQSALQATVTGVGIGTTSNGTLPSMTIPSVSSIMTVVFTSGATVHGYGFRGIVHASVGPIPSPSPSPSPAPAGSVIVRVSNQLWQCQLPV